MNIVLDYRKKFIGIIVSMLIGNLQFALAHNGEAFAATMITVAFAIACWNKVRPWQLVVLCAAHFYVYIIPLPKIDLSFLQLPDVNLSEARQPLKTIEYLIQICFCGLMMVLERNRQFQ